jgi:hypothetical protein
MIRRRLLGNFAVLIAGVVEALKPHAGEAHLARGENSYRGYLDYDNALTELEVLVKPCLTISGYSS